MGAGRGTHGMEVDGQISEDAGQKRRLLDEPLMAQGVPQVAPFLRHDPVGKLIIVIGKAIQLQLAIGKLATMIQLES